MTRLGLVRVLGNRGAGNKVVGLIALMRLPLDALAAARGTLFPWVPVFLGIGIGLWFLLPWEPGVTFYVWVTVGAVAAVALRLTGPEAMQPLAVALACLLVGMLAAGMRAHRVDAPMLTFRYYGPVEGRLIAVDRSQSDALRLTLDRVVLSDVPPARTPLRVRVSLQEEPQDRVPEPGETVILTAHLSAPEGPVEPGGFDFRRMAFFDQLGAVGYTRSPVLILEPAADSAQSISRLRLYLSASMREAIGGDAGAFAAGVMTGDRSGLSLETIQALRDSSLAHLLAISGMNMAFLVAFVFGLIRGGVALVPPLALRVNAKKAAAVISMGVAGFYLLLSGANVATERAFIMVIVMLGAILLDRRALTMRSVAIAAVILLLWQPESLLEPGFQMSFAATVALIAGFRAIEGRVMRERLPRWSLPVFTLVMSSVIAGVATAPYGAAHFNRFTDFGLIANLLTVPVMGAVVMPAGVMAALLAPFGLAAPALWVMEMGVRWILAVAVWIAGWEGAVTAIPEPQAMVLPLITLGGLWLILWQGRARLAGVAVILSAVALWTQAPRPELLIAGNGGLVGLMGPEGRALSVGKGGGFAAKSWLENDGDLAEQADAVARPGFVGPRGVRRFEVAGLQGVALAGKAGLAGLAEACAGADLVILAEVAEPRPESCALIDEISLRQTGAIAGWVEGGKLVLVPTRQATRLWTGRPLDPEALPVLDAPAVEVARAGPLPVE